MFGVLPLCHPILCLLKGRGVHCYPTLCLRGGGGAGLPVPSLTDICAELWPRSHALRGLCITLLSGGWGMHHVTLGTCRSRPSEARELVGWVT